MKNVKNHVRLKYEKYYSNLYIRISSFDIVRPRDFLPREGLCRKVTANDTIV